MIRNPMAAIAVGALTALPMQAAAEPVEWQLDKAHTKVGFVATHLGFSKVDGHFNKFDAKIKADDKTGKITSLEATAYTDSVDTGIAKRDGHLKSNDFFLAKKYPKLTLTTRSIKWRGDSFTAKASLTLRGVTQPVTLKGKLLGKGRANLGAGDQIHAGYEAKTTISRKKFGLKFSKVSEGLAVVGDEVEIVLNAEIVRKL